VKNGVGQSDTRELVQKTFKEAGAVTGGLKITGYIGYNGFVGGG